MSALEAMAEHVAKQLVEYRGVKPLNQEEKRALLRMDPRDLWAPDVAERIQQEMQNENAKPDP